MSASHSESENRNSTSTNTELTTRNNNVSGNTGLTATAVEGGSLNLNYAPVTLDGGAISAASSSAALAIDNAGKANELIRSLAHESAMLFSNSENRALDIVQATTRENSENAAGFAALFAKSLGDAATAQQTQLGNVVSALNKSFVENNTSANQQVINATTEAGQQAANLISDVFKYIAIAAGVGIVAFLAVKGKKVFAA